MRAEDWEDYEDDYLENGLRENCSNCGRPYDEIDFDYQSCSKCGWDDENQCWGFSREPTEEEYLNGEADILTGDFF